MGNCLAISADEGVKSRPWNTHPAHDEWVELQDLGHGSFSKVVLAEYKNEKKTVSALKIVFLDDPGLNAATKHLLLQEGELLSELCHPHIISCRSILPSPDILVYELEYLEGCTVLDGIFYLRNTYSEKDAAKIIAQVVDAVGYIHSKGVIHRDIKPENVVFVEKIPESRTLKSLYETPQVKLLDFGLAYRIPDDPDVVERGCLGSAGFIAPEVIKGQRHTPAMDIYGLGVLLFIMLVGRKPYDLEQCEKLKYHDIPIEQAPALRDSRWKRLSPDAKNLVMGMLASNPDERLTAGEILEHEWIKTEGGGTIRHLGKSIAMGAATVAEMRRIRFLSKGLAALESPDTSGSSSSKIKRKNNKERYLEELDRSIRMDKSAHGGNSILGSAARSLAAKSFAMAHDAGRSVQEKVLEGSHYGSRAMNSDDAISENSVRNVFNSMTGEISAFKLFSQSVSQYIEEKSVRRGTVYDDILDNPQYQKDRVVGDRSRDSGSHSQASSHNGHPHGRKVNVVKVLNA